MSWNVKRLPIGEVCTLVNGRAFKPTDWTETGTPIVRIQNLNDLTKPFNCYLGDVADKHIVNSGDILLSWSGTPGTSFGCFVWSRGRAILNQHIFRVHVHERIIDKNYFVYAVNGHLDEMIALAHGGVGLRHITKGKLESIEIPVPPLPEQRRIVARIQELMSRADEIRRLREETARQADVVEAALVADLLTDLPSTTKQITLDDVLTRSQYGTSQKASLDGSGVPVYRMGNLQRGQLVHDDMKFVNLADTEQRKYALRRGDILINRTNSMELVGKAACVSEVPSGSVFASYLVRLIVDTTKADPEYVTFIINSRIGREYVLRTARRAISMVNINAEEIGKMPLVLPPLAEQRRMVAKFLEARATCDALRGSLDDAAISTLPTAILRKAFAGEL